MYHRCKCRAYIEAQLQVERDTIADNSVLYSFLHNFAQIIAESSLTAASIARRCRLQEQIATYYC
jgi:hypothetical protein